ncbi:MAG: MarR family transcriptional regulator [Rhodobacteraceae bacterium]|nr:MarR family transcriptional regulator [Paracoccaceae bacterium]
MAGRPAGQDSKGAGDPRPWFSLFTEIGIIAQLSAAAFEAEMPGWLVSQFGVLQHLVLRGDGATPLELARAFQVPKTTMTHTLKLLEGRGMVTLSPNPADGRSKIVRLTPAGAAFREEAIGRLSLRMTRLAEHPGLADPQDLLPQLRALREVLDATRDEKPEG